MELNKSFVISMLLIIKNKYFDEKFVSLKEYNVITEKIRNKINEVNLDICINDEIDIKYFEMISNIIIVNKEKDIPLEYIYQEYIGLLPANIIFKFINIIGNERFLYNCILETKLSHIANTMEHSCKNCNTYCSGGGANYSCERWTHNVVLGKNRVLKK